MTDKEIKFSAYSDDSGVKMDKYSHNSKTRPHESVQTKINIETGGGIIANSKEGSRQKTDTQCYLTVACMKHFSEEFDENCYELSTLRWFINTFMSKEDIDHYYEISPLIVDSINKTPKCERIYSYIYKNIIDVCVKAIEQGNYEFAYNKYKNSVLTLEEEYVNSFLETDKNKVLTKVY